MALTNKQKNFIEEYLIDFNATQAAIRAGYSSKTANRIATENLSKPVIQKEIERRIQERQQRTEITQDRIVEELAALSFSKITDYLEIENGEVIFKDTSELTEDQKRAILSVKQTQYGIEIKLNNKTKPLELLGRHLGMWNDKESPNGNAESQISDFLEAVKGRLVENDG